MNTPAPNEIDSIIKAFNGDYGWTVRIGMIRTQFLLYVPMLNNWLQSKMTAALAYSPAITNDIVNYKTYKVVAFLLLLCTDIKLPSADSIKLHEQEALNPSIP